MKKNAANGYEKTKPKQTQFPKSPNESKVTYNKGLQKKRRFRSPKKQTQFKPNFLKAKMNVNLFATKDYENKSDFKLQKNKPNSNPIKPKPRILTHLPPFLAQIQGFAPKIRKKPVKTEISPEFPTPKTPHLLTK